MRIDLAEKDGGSGKKAAGRTENTGGMDNICGRNHVCEKQRADGKDDPYRKKYAGGADGKASDADVPAGEMEQINRYTRRDLSQEEVYRFKVNLCDNDIDRDGECFTRQSLEALAGLFLGKTGIFDHDPKSGGQTARIYHTQVVCEPGRTTEYGEEYAVLQAKAYMVRSGDNEPLIMEIDGGIKKEVSVGCSVARMECSVCGADLRQSPCGHVKGAAYGGAVCYTKLLEPTDAYEWSFVAVPAQKNAGVVKRYGDAPARRSTAEKTDPAESARDFPGNRGGTSAAGGTASARMEEKSGGGEGYRDGEDILKLFRDAPSGLTLDRHQVKALQTYTEQLRRLAGYGEQYERELRRRVKRWSLLRHDGLDASVVDKMVDGMGVDDLLAMEKVYRSRYGGLRLAGASAEKEEPGSGNQMFRV